MTFRFREAVLALADMEGWVVERPSRLRETLAERMEANPEHWADYYRGDPARLRMLKLLSYSDRVRYYWNDPEVANALERLLHNLSGGRLTDTVVSQYLQGVDVRRDPDRPPRDRQAPGAELGEPLLRCLRLPYRRGETPMKAIVYQSPGKLDVATLPVPTPAPGTVLVRTASCGICHTDIEVLHGRYGSSAFPLVPGHEYSGTVEQVGGVGIDGVGR